MVEEKRRIMLVDKDILFRTSVRYTLEQMAGTEIICECTSAEEAISKIKALNPDIILMDNALPGMNGIKACREITGNGDICNVIIFSDDQELVSHAISSGATFCFTKDIAPAELVTATALISQWQSLKTRFNDSCYSIHQIEAMMMKHLATCAALEESGEKVNDTWLPPADDGPCDIREVTLVIPAPGDISQLQKFIFRVKETLKAEMSETGGSWGETHIKLLPRRPASLASMLLQIAMMPEVEGVVEKEPGRAGRFPFSRNTGKAKRPELMVTLSAGAQPIPVTEPAYRHIDVQELQPQMAEAPVS